MTDIIPNFSSALFYAGPAFSLALQFSKYVA